MTPLQMLDALEDAIAVARRQLHSDDDLVMTLCGPPTVLGQTGLPASNAPGEYDFTLAQCEAMRDRLLDVARSEALALMSP